MYGEPSGFTQAMRIGLPRARNASFSASDIPPTVPRQALSVISRTSPSSPVGSGEPVRCGRLSPSPAGARAPRFTFMNSIETDALTPYAASLARVPYTGIRELEIGRAHV